MRSACRPVFSGHFPSAAALVDSILRFNANSFCKIITMSTSLKTTESIKRAYVEGFLEGLATHGVTPSQIGRAFQTKLAFSLGDTANLALLAAVGTPAVVGYAGGRAIAAARGTEDQEAGGAPDRAER